MGNHRKTVEIHVETLEIHWENAGTLWGNAETHRETLGIVMIALKNNGRSSTTSPRIQCREPLSDHKEIFKSLHENLGNKRSRLS